MPGGRKNLIMDTMIAYCGLACNTCPIHLATLEQVLAKRQTMRAAIAHMCREQYGMNLQLRDITDCDGCRSGTGRLFSGCARCEIRKCAIDRKFTSCAFCADYACEKLLKHFETDPSAQVRLEKLRSVG
jgi:hypothetical protein